MPNANPSPQRRLIESSSGRAGASQRPEVRRHGYSTGAIRSTFLVAVPNAFAEVRSEEILVLSQIIYLVSFLADEDAGSTLLLRILLWLIFI